MDKVDVGKDKVIILVVLGVILLVFFICCFILFDNYVILGIFVYKICIYILVIINY